MNRHLLEELAQLVAYALYNKLANNEDMGDGFNHKYLHRAVKASTVVALNSLASGSAKEMYDKFGMASSTLSNNLVIAEELGLPRVLGSSDEQIAADRQKVAAIKKPLKAAKKRKSIHKANPIITMNPEALLDVVRSGQFAVIYITSSNCSPCALMGPIFKEVAAKEKVATMYKVVADEHPAVMGLLGVRSVPTIVCIKDGIIIYRHSGIMQLRSMVQLMRYLYGVGMVPIIAALGASLNSTSGVPIDAPPKYLNHYNAVGSSL